MAIAIGQRPLIDALERVKDSFNSYPLDRLAEAGATAAIEDDAWFNDSCAKVIASARAPCRRPAQRAALTCFPRRPTSSLRDTPPTPAPISRRNSARSAILVRHFERPRISDFLRITIGTDEDCARLIDAIDAIAPGGRPASNDHAGATIAININRDVRVRISART